MFQDLLVTRFGLVTHWETRELKAFEVRVSEQGPKLQEAKNHGRLSAIATVRPDRKSHSVREQESESEPAARITTSVSSAAECSATRESRVPSQPLLDAEELVEFRHPLASATRTGLDVSGARRNRHVGNEGVLGFA
jgi:uncharacterized protein (TIGR03435 family)